MKKATTMLNLPNYLTFIRIASIPFFLVLLFSRLYLDLLGGPRQGRESLFDGLAVT